MSVCRGHNLAVLTHCASTPMDPITAAVRQITLATDETVHGQVRITYSFKVASMIIKWH